MPLKNKRFGVPSVDLQILFLLQCAVTAIPCWEEMSFFRFLRERCIPLFVSNKPDIAEFPLAVPSWQNQAPRLLYSHSPLSYAWYCLLVSTMRERNKTNSNLLRTDLNLWELHSHHLYKETNKRNQNEKLIWNCFANRHHKVSVFSRLFLQLNTKTNINRLAFQSPDLIHNLYIVTHRVISLF